MLRVRLDVLPAVVQRLDRPVHELEVEQQIVVFSVILRVEKELVVVETEIVYSLHGRQVRFRLVLLVSPELGFSAFQLDALQS